MPGCGLFLGDKSFQLECKGRVGKGPSSIPGAWCFLDIVAIGMCHVLTLLVLRARNIDGNKEQCFPCAGGYTCTQTIAMKLCIAYAFWAFHLCERPT